jgi:hypothetical protein
MSLIINVPTDLPAQGGKSTPVPAGNYPVTVYEVKAETVKSGANAGKPRWNVQLRVSEGQYENRRFFAYVPLYVAGDFWKTQSFFESLGYDVKGAFSIPETVEVLGKPLTLASPFVRQRVSTKPRTTWLVSTPLRLVALRHRALPMSPTLLTSG